MNPTLMAYGVSEDSETLTTFNLTIPKGITAEKLLNFVYRNQHHAIGRVLISPTTYKDIKRFYPELTDGLKEFEVLGYMTVVHGKKEFEIELL